MPFDHCKECKKCCHVDAGFPPLEIPLLPVEKKQWKRIEIKTSCRFLADRGCELGSSKPFACFQYPLSFDPNAQRFLFDADCPLYERYQAQLKQPGSEARAHLTQVVQHITGLGRQGARFVKRNYELDVDYFELLPLEVPAELMQPLQKGSADQK